MAWPAASRPASPPAATGAAPARSTLAPVSGLGTIAASSKINSSYKVNWVTMWDTDNAGSNAPATANTTWPGPATGNWDDHAEYNYGYSSDCPGASVPSVIQYRFPECEVVMNVAIHWMRGERAVAWTYGDQRIVKEFDEPLRTVTYLDGPPSIVIVESVTSPSAPRNAVVYNLDGTERVRLQPPARLLHAAIGFDQVFQSATVVEAVFATRGGDFHGEPDLVTGELRDVNDWR